MNEQLENTSAAFMEVTMKKTEGQDRRIASIEEKVNLIPDNTGLIQKAINSIEGLRNEVKNNRFPTKMLEDFTETINKSFEIYQELVKRKIVHHHHVPKIIWIAAGLFIAFAFACAGWYSTSNKLDSYIASDTKYRQLRLDTANKSLQSYLDQMDSLYYTRTDMRKIVLQQEEDNRKNFERLEKADRLKAEAKELETQARRKSITKH